MGRRGDEKSGHKKGPRRLFTSSVLPRFFLPHPRTLESIRGWLPLLHGLFLHRPFFSSLAFSALLPEGFPSRKPTSLFARILFLLRNWGRRGKLGALQLCSCLFIMPYKRTGTFQQGLIPFETQIPILG